MIEAGLWSLVASSTLVLGAAAAFVLDISAKVRGLVLGFGAGVLFGSVAYELVQQALRASMTGVDVALGFAAGALAFYGGSRAIDALLGPPPDPSKPGGRRRLRRALGLSLLFGAVLDGIPESVVLGLSVVSGEGVSLAILLAILLSNAPEALSASEGLHDGGMRPTRILALWLSVAVVSSLAAVLAAAAADVSSSAVVILAQAFAAGGLLAMLSESALPEAHEDGGREVGLASALGFAVAAWLALRPPA